MHPSQFKKREDVVNYAVNAIAEKKKKEFQGGFKKELPIQNEKIDVKR